jgi:hypothetical protein
VYLCVTKDTTIKSHMRLATIVDKFTTHYAGYKYIINSLSNIAFIYRFEMIGSFISEAKTNAWLLPIGMLINRLLESLLYIYAAVLFIGIYVFNNINRKSLYDRYIVIMLIAYIMLFYIHIISSWWIDYRHICIVLIPCCLFIGYGLSYILSYIKQHARTTQGIAVLLIALAIVLTTMPKNLFPRDIDKDVFKAIGQFIANRETDAEGISISSPSNIHRWISFYANMPYKGVVCPDPTPENSWELTTADQDQFVRHLKEGHIKYLVWTERQWPDDKIDFAGIQSRLNLKELGRWHHPDTGEIVLFEVTPLQG